jgi:hypothetical protein
MQHRRLACGPEIYFPMDLEYHAVDKKQLLFFMALTNNQQCHIIVLCKQTIKQSGKHERASGVEGE